MYRAARKAAGYVKPDRRKRRGKKVLAPLTDQDDPRHGTMNGYNNHRCRCVECRQANAEYTRDLKRRAEPPPPGDPRHGKATTYRNRKCRCEPCADARRAYERTRRARKRLNAVPDDAVTA